MKDGKRFARHICIIAERTRHVKGGCRGSRSFYPLHDCEFLLLRQSVGKEYFKLSPGSYTAVDRFEIMLYDIYDDEGRHSTPETFMELSKKLRRYSIPSEKIGLGLPFYAKPSDRTAYWYAYADYCDKLNENGFYYDSELDKAFWFNRPSEIVEKTRFAVEKGFGGIMIWHYSRDLPSSNPHSLLKAVGDTVSSLSSV